MYLVFPLNRPSVVPRNSNDLDFVLRFKALDPHLLVYVTPMPQATQPAPPLSHQGDDMPPVRL